MIEKKSTEGNTDTRDATTNATSRLIEFCDNQQRAKPLVDQLKKFKMAAIRVQNIAN